RTYAPFTDWLRGVAYGNNLFVTVGENGRIATSSNGSDWKIRQSGTTANLNRVAWITNCFWVAGNGGTVLVSDTGSNWNMVSSGTTNDLYAAAGNSNTLLLAGDNELRLGWLDPASPDNPVWSNELDLLKTNAAPQWTYYNAVWDGGAFVVGGRTGMLVEGYDTNLVATNYTWALLHKSFWTWLWDLTQVNDLYVAVGDRATVLTSGNGAHWDFEYVPNSFSNSIFLGIGGASDGLVAVGNQGAMMFSPNLWTNVVVTNLDGTNLVISTNQTGTMGLLWQAMEPRPTDNDLQGVCCFSNRWVVTGGGGTILTSNNGTNWTARPTSTSAFLSSVTAFPYGWVAAGDLGTLLTSPDGASWTLLPSLTTNWLYRVRYLGGRLLAVGENGMIMTSTNGLSWTPQNSGTDRWLNDVALLDGVYYAVGTQGAVLFSTDTVHWTVADFVSNKSLYALAANHHQLVAAGIEGILLRGQLAPAQIQQYYQNIGTNRFVLSGFPGLDLTLDHGIDSKSWTAGPELRFLDNSGLLLFQESATNSATSQFYRPNPH
ncbi:MAG: hypothetical protein M1608_00700, partial [Candidatus Omnitrophica bacterium]|nr:hypothetical protein [Candidatus Omnitrophota bacterium]